MCRKPAILKEKINLRKVAKKLTLLLVFFLKKNAILLFILLKEKKTKKTGNSLQFKKNITQLKGVYF
jgi:hypothetical protein